MFWGKEADGFLYLMFISTLTQEECIVLSYTVIYMYTSFSIFTVCLFC